MPGAGVWTEALAKARALVANMTLAEKVWTPPLVCLAEYRAGS